MSLYTRAIASVGYATEADVGFGFKSIRRGVSKAARKTGRVAKKVGKVAVLTAVPPAGIAYVAHKAIQKRKAKKRAAANARKQGAPISKDDGDGGGGFADDEPSDDGGGSEDENEQDASDDSDDELEDSDGETGDNTMSDEIGWDEIGDDVDAMLGDEYVGAAPARRGQRPGPNAMLVRQKGFSKSREYPLGFASSGTIAAAASATITAAPQTLFRPKRLVIPSSIAGSFTIQDIKVGNQSQLVASGSLPAALYSELAVGTMQRYDTAPPGIIISLSVTNTSGGALAFVAAMVGDSVQ